MWNSRSLENGQKIGRGEIHFTSGRLVVTMASSAQLTIKGPAQLEILDTNAVRLHQGIANFNCPSKAEGFLVALRGDAQVG